MVRVDIESIVMASAPVPSLIVLRERSTSDADDAPQRSLSIQTGSYEAASIGHGIEQGNLTRPITADISLSLITKLGGKLERVVIDRMDAPTFMADLVLSDADGKEMRIDSRPSDALALAVRANAPIFVEDDVMNRAGSTSAPNTDSADEQAELEQFDKFVQTLTPDDF